MFPTLFSIGNINVSSVGVFLALGFLLGVFLIWRLARAWDLNEEKTLDLTLLTFLGGLIGARVYFILENPMVFISSPLNIILINKAPGLSFWGGFLGGWLALYFFTRRFRLDFWQLADIAIVGLLGGLILSNLGCMLGSCNSGVVSKAFFAITQEGLVGKRWPVQIAEAMLLSFVLIKLWSLATHFHQRGKIVSLGFISIGVIGLMLEPLKQRHSNLLLSGVLIVLGLIIYYRVIKKSPLTHLKQLKAFLAGLFTNPKVSADMVQSFSKTWYNQKALIGWKIRNFKKSLRKTNVKLSKRDS